MTLEATHHSSAEQEAQLRAQLFDQLLKKAAIERELEDVTKSVLGLTNILGGVTLGKAVATEQIKAQAEKLKAAEVPPPADR
jgi:hypothetical protein